MALPHRQSSPSGKKLNGLINDSGGDAQISTAMRVLAAEVSPRTAWFVAVNRPIDVGPSRDLPELYSNRLKAVITSTKRGSTTPAMK
jgi:hypothetical protein